MEVFESSHRWLESEYLARRKRNPAYSLRAFARLLDIPSGRVSQLLSHRRRITPKLGRKIATHLGYDPQKTERLLQVVHRERTKKAVPEASPKLKKTYRQLNMDQFQSIADPVHFSLLSLAETDGFQGNPRFIARRLNISVVEARAALERLARLHLMRSTDQGKFELAQEPGLTTSHDIQSSALKKAHKKILLDTIHLLETIEVDGRDITSIVMAIDPSHLPKAKKMIREFRRSLSEFLETGKKSEVFRLNIQLVPVTKGGAK